MQIVQVDASDVDRFFGFHATLVTYHRVFDDAGTYRGVIAQAPNGWTAITGITGAPTFATQDEAAHYLVLNCPTPPGETNAGPWNPNAGEVAA